MWHMIHDSQYCAAWVCAHPLVTMCMYGVYVPQGAWACRGWGQLGPNCALLTAGASLPHGSLELRFQQAKGCIYAKNAL